MVNVLDSGVKLVRNVGRYIIGASLLSEIKPFLAKTRKESFEKNSLGK
jgi:hypothetical protein